MRMRRRLRMPELAIASHGESVFMSLSLCKDGQHESLVLLGLRLTRSTWHH